MKSNLKIMAIFALLFLLSFTSFSQKVKKATTNWKGFYVGGNVGLNAANTSMVTSTGFCGGFGVNGCYFAQSKR